jgi:hypothetical protein
VNLAALRLLDQPDQPMSRQRSLAEVAARSSRGVFCLLTALRFHKITTPSSDAIWLAIPNKARAPTSVDGDPPPPDPRSDPPS